MRAGDYVFFVAFWPSEHERIGVIDEVLTAGTGVSYNVLDEETQVVHGLLGKYLRPASLLDRIAWAARDR